MQVPVSARVRAGVAVEAMIAFIDFNPIPKVLEFRPLAAEPYLGFRVRVQQATPIRVAARTVHARPSGTGRHVRRVQRALGLDAHADEAVGGMNVDDGGHA